MEYRQIGPRAMAVKPQSRVELGFAQEVLCREGVAPSIRGRDGDSISRTALVRDPYAGGSVGGEGL